MTNTLIIYDCDGTLVDSAALIIESMSRAFGDLGLVVPDQDAIRRVVGLSLTSAISRLQPDTDMDGLHRIANAYKGAFAVTKFEPEFDQPLYPGARDCVRAMREKGAKTAIATGKSRKGLAHVLERHEMHELFDALITADDAQSKPHPEMIELLQWECDAQSERTVMIGDTSFDIEMGKAAKAYAVGVSWGNHPAEELTQAGADVVLDEFAALEPWLADINLLGGLRR